MSSATLANSTTSVASCTLVVLLAHARPPPRSLLLLAASARTRHSVRPELHLVRGRRRDRSSVLSETHVSISRTRQSAHRLTDRADTHRGRVDKLAPGCSCWDRGRGTFVRSPGRRRRSGGKQIMRSHKQHVCTCENLILRCHSCLPVVVEFVDSERPR
jgi:hypothetical protein